MPALPCPPLQLPPMAMLDGDGAAVAAALERPVSGSRSGGPGAQQQRGRESLLVQVRFLLCVVVQLLYSCGSTVVLAQW
jgi:hypothetical protein